MKRDLITLVPPAPRAPGRDPDAARARRARGASDAVPLDYFRDLVLGLTNGVIAVTAEGRLAVMNDVACRVLDIDPSARGRHAPFGDALASCPEIVRVLGSVGTLDHLPTRAELRLERSGKTIGYTLCRVRDAGGADRGAVVLFRDLTDVERQEERERLRDRLAALGEMAAAIAHEVKNPLAGIGVMAGLLKRRAADDEARRLATEIIQEARMANAIVMEVLDFVRPIRLQVEPVAMGAVLREAVHRASSIDGTGRPVGVHVEAALPDVEGDAQQLSQLFTNLVTNALEATADRRPARHEPPVRITARLDPASPGHVAAGPVPAVVVEVRDDGPGVPDEVRDRLFRPFFTTKPRGTGLGLAIVRKIVDAHEGRIDVSSQAGRGTCVRVTLLVTARRQPPVVALEDAGAPGGPRARAAVSRRRIA